MSSLSLSELADALPPPTGPTSEQLEGIFDALDPLRPASDRSAAIVSLARLVAGSTSAPPTTTDVDRLTPTFLSPLTDRLSLPQPKPVAQALSLLTSLFSLSPPLAAALFLSPDVQSQIQDIPDLLAASREAKKSTTANREEWDAVRRCLSGLLAQAAGVAECRETVREGWAEWLAREDGTGSALALLKLSRAPAPGEPASGEDEQLRLARQMMDVVSSSNPNTDSLSDAIEGLALLSPLPATKSLLASSPPFLRSLLALIPSPRSPSPPAPSATLYGLSLILASLCAYPAVLSSEEAQVDRLRHLASSGATSKKLAVPPQDPRESPAAALERCRTLLPLGVLPALVSLSRVDSPGVREEVGRALCALAEDRGARGLVVREGGARALRSIISSLLTPSSTPTSLPPSALPALHALSKLTIALPPSLLFPSPLSSSTAIRPLCLLLLHASSTPIQQFEALLALTNLASFPSSPDAESIAVFPGLLAAVESHLLAGDTLLRRAGTELICNLLSASPTARAYFARGRGRVELLLAMTDVEDVETRRAGCAALVGLTSDEEGVGAVLGGKGEGEEKVWVILGRMINPSSKDGGDDDDDEGEEELDLPLAHRALVLISNLLSSSSPSPSFAAAVRAEIPQSLVGLVVRYKELAEAEGGEVAEVVRRGVEGLAWFVRRGWKVEGIGGGK